MSDDPLGDYNEHQFRVARILRWVLFIPSLYGSAFCCGAATWNAGSMGKAIGILIPALIGIVTAPRHRIFATAFAYFYGNYLYATNIDFIYAENYYELLIGYKSMLIKHFPLFVIPTAVTLLVAIVLDVRETRIEASRQIIQPQTRPA